ncbi:MAG: cysteine desulfurase [Clostridiaceae bacterium]|nr:cysteine desulfurase [Clostridiaceae bacterium]
MIYLDYSAQTPPSELALSAFLNTPFLGNPNARHDLGKKGGKLIEETLLNISSLLGVLPSEIIYTSSASEANNLAIKGVAGYFKGAKKHIITTHLEHSSVSGPINYLKSLGYEVEYVDLDDEGKVDVGHLKELLRKDTLLVSVCYTDSEMGITQDIDKIGRVIKENSNAYFHTDASQALGKVKLSLEYVDLATISSQKIYGLCGIGALIKKENVLLEPIIHGGASITPFRSGTPALNLIVSFSAAVKEAVDRQEERHEYVKGLNSYLQSELKSIKGIYINSTASSVPHILNISIPGKNSEEAAMRLSDKDIYLSTKSACSHENAPSHGVLMLTRDKKRALSTLRISLSHLTTLEELKTFLAEFKDILRGI